MAIETRSHGKRCSPRFVGIDVAQRLTAGFIVHGHRTINTLTWVPFQVQLFRWVEKDDGVQELSSECGYHGHILALFMQVKWNMNVLGRLVPFSL